jgi:hypothetical protein
MTDRIHSLQVVLAHDMREDDLPQLIAAVSCFRGVISVQPMVADPGTLMAEARADVKWQQKLAALLRPPP